MRDNGRFVTETRLKKKKKRKVTKSTFHAPRYYKEKGGIQSAREVGKKEEKQQLLSRAHHLGGC